MTTEELQELLDLRGWSKMDLAHALDVTENAIYKWFASGRTPHGPASILLRAWLEESRRAGHPVGK